MSTLNLRNKIKYLYPLNWEQKLPRQPAFPKQPRFTLAILLEILLSDKEWEILVWIDQYDILENFEWIHPIRAHNATDHQRNMQYTI